MMADFCKGIPKSIKMEFYVYRPSRFKILLWGLNKSESPLIASNLVHFYLKNKIKTAKAFIVRLSTQKAIVME